MSLPTIEFGPDADVDTLAATLLTGWPDGVVVTAHLADGTHLDVTVQDITNSHIVGTLWSGDVETSSPAALPVAQVTRLVIF